MRITINMGSDHQLTEEQYENLNDELQELADNADMDFSAEDHSTNDGGDYYFIFKDDFGMELGTFVSFIEDIQSSIKACLNAEYHEWWTSFE